MQIATHLPAIIRLIETNAVVSIVAPTGSGKSVAVPAAISSAGARCFVTVPTRTAAVSLSEYQKTLQRNANPNINVDKFVGYAAEGNVNYSKDTYIAYVTGGHARRKMLKYFNKGVASAIDFCDVLMVDEVHSGSVDTTIIISLWMKAAASGVQVPRLVVASATPVPIIIEPTPVVYTVELQAYPITFVYLNEDIDIDLQGELYGRAGQLAYDIHKNTEVNTGHILIFAPGSSEVEIVAEKLKQLNLDVNPNKIMTIIPAYGALKQDDIALIYKNTGPNERKIVIATNIAETAITISDVGHVIDTLTEKRAETSVSGGFRLTTRYISKDSAKQRAGRTGRTRAGICYRMCTQQTFETLEQHRPPEIERVPIYDTIMELLDIGLSPETTIKGIDIQRVIQATRLLTSLGMITKDASGITVTEMGHFAPRFHISVRNSAFLWKWIQGGYPIFPGIVTACLIDSYGPSYFWVPRRNTDMSVQEYNLMVQAHKTKYFDKFIGSNDLETSLNMWNDFVSVIGGIQPSAKQISTWTRENSINNKKMRELIMIIQQSVNAAVNLGLDVQIGPFTTQGVMAAARPILLSVYSDTTFIQKSGVTYYSPITKEEYRLDNRDSINKMSLNPPKGIIALVTAEIKTQKGIFRVIGFGVDTDKDGFGRDIEVKGSRRDANIKALTRGPRTREFEPKVVQQRTVENNANITNALELLARLNMGTVPVNILPQYSPVDINREYTRYWYVNAMQENLIKDLNEKQSYEALNCLERWLIALANIPSAPDPIFSEDKLDVNTDYTIKFVTELQEKNIPDPGGLVGSCIAIGLGFAQLVSFDPVTEPIQNGNTIIVGAYSKTLTPERLNILLNKGTIMDIAAMLLRYDCLLPRGQQWNIPYPVYELLGNKYNYTVEGFASPINSQIIKVNPEFKFCSVFPDTDYKFGSLGSFFDQKFDNVRLIINPPYIISIMEKMVNFLSTTFDTAINLNTFVIVPKWTDAQFYNTLANHKYLQKIIPLTARSYYFVNSTNEDEKIVANFPTTIFILSKGNMNINYEQLQIDLGLAYHK